jgi:alkylation response protein AidB-like acyl-CoA dehydrogenase
MGTPGGYAMNFDFSEEQLLLRDQARKFLSERAAPARVRRILESDAPYDRELWDGLAEMAWPGTAIPEAYGGAGYGYLELCVIAEELGRSLAPTPFSSSVYLATEAILLAGTEDQRKRWLPRLASGQAIGCFAMAEGPQTPRPGSITARATGGQLTGAKVPVADGDVADLAVVLARTDDGGRGGTSPAPRAPATAEYGDDAAALFLVDLRASGVARTAVTTLDPTRSHARIEFEGAAAELLGAPGEGWALAEHVMDRAAVLFAFEQVGGAQAALDMAREYALGRFAFGRPIASFQAIKHKLVDIYVALELARSNAYYAAWALSTDSPELPVAAAAARVSATEAFFLAAKENIQTHGGMGFTWEFDCHMYYRRAKLLALTLGSARTWKDRLIARLEARGAA